MPEAHEFKRSLFAGLMAWRRTFEGGLYLPDVKGDTARRPIEPFTPPMLHVPLQHAASLPTVVKVKAGQQVAAGDALADAAGPESLPVYSPAAGRIIALDRVWTARDGFLPAAMIEVTEAVASTDRASRTTNTNPTQDALDELIRQAALLDPVARRPLHVLRHQPGINALIVNAMETEPGLTADLRILVEQSEGVLPMVARLANSVPFTRAALAIPLRHRRVCHFVRRLARGTAVEVAVLPDKYPQCHQNLLTRVVFGRTVPPGGAPSDVGVLVLSIQTLAALADFAATGRPQLTRVVTVYGDGVERPGNYRVPIGTPVRSLLSHVGVEYRADVLIAGSPMMGVALPTDETAITLDVPAIIPRATRAWREPVPCIRCGWCLEDCPVGIDPRSLMQLELAERIAASPRRELAACVECGICSYVCPAHLPLTETMVQLRRRVEAGAVEEVAS